MGYIGCRGINADDVTGVLIDEGLRECAGSASHVERPARRNLSPIEKSRCDAPAPPSNVWLVGVAAVPGFRPLHIPQFRVASCHSPPRAEISRPSLRFLHGPFTGDILVLHLPMPPCI